MTTIKHQTVLYRARKYAIALILASAASVALAKSTYLVQSDRGIMTQTGKGQYTITFKPPVTIQRLFKPDAPLHKPPHSFNGDGKTLWWLGSPSDGAKMENYVATVQSMSDNNGNVIINVSAKQGHSMKHYEPARALIFGQIFKNKPTAQAEN